MNKTEIINNMTRTFNRVGFKVKKHSPEILMAAGVIGTVTSAVMACKATTKLSDIMDESKKTVDQIHYAIENPEELPEEYTPEDGKKDLAITYVQTGIKLAKLYAPAVILGSLSITAMVSSNNILRKRNITLAAAYTAIDKSFKDYRGRVVERFGKELDKELRYNIKAKEFEERVVDEKTGKITRKDNPRIRHKSLRVLDYDYDQDYIVGAFQQLYGIDLTVENIHWWRFKMLFNSLTKETKLVEIMGYRSMEINPKWDESHRKFYQDMKILYALPDNRTEEEKERDFQEQLNNALGGG